VLQAFPGVPKIEMHDRMIVATAMIADGAVVTKDREIHRVYPRTVW